jgi:hypothetical protein
MKAWLESQAPRSARAARRSATTRGRPSVEVPFKAPAAEYSTSEGTRSNAAQHKRRALSSDLLGQNVTSQVSHLKDAPGLRGRPLSPALAQCVGRAGSWTDAQRPQSWMSGIRQLRGPQRNPRSRANVELGATLRLGFRQPALALPRSAP